MRSCQEFKRKSESPGRQGLNVGPEATFFILALGVTVVLLVLIGTWLTGVTVAGASSPKMMTADLPVRDSHPDSIQPNPRIIGGANVERGWQVALGLGNRSFSGGQFCGGTLIATDLVLTAAHCVLSDRTKNLDRDLARHGIKVLAGRSSLSGAGGQVRWVEFVGSWAERYRPNGNLAWDIALLKTSEPFTGGEPIKIAGSDESYLWSEGRPVWASGWGDMKGGIAPDYLKGTWLTVFSNRACRAAWKSAGWDWSTQFCAGAAPKGGRGTCSGDSGGPLVAKASTGVRRLVGVTSFGWSKRCGTYRPDAFAKVASEPMRSVIAEGARHLSPGADVIGAGEMSPPLIDGFDAWANAGLYVGHACDLNRRCARVQVRQCIRQSQGLFRCRVSQFLFGRRSLKTATRRVLIIDDGVRVVRRPLGFWRSARGWR